MKLIFTLIGILLCSSVLCQDVSCGILRGYIWDGKTDLPLTSANIFIKDELKGTVSNEKGYFELSLPEGIYTVIARMVGYKEQTKHIIITPDEYTDIFYELVPTSYLLDSVTVCTKHNNYNLSGMSYELQAGELKDIPQFGEPDPIRVMFALPGVNAVNDLSNQLYVRGGNFFETMIALDDMPIYNPYHLGGIYSSVNSDIVGREKLYLSNYPISYGGYLSGLVSLSSKTVESDEQFISLSMGLTSTKGYLELPLGKGNLILSARRTYFDLVGEILSEDFPYYFYDVYGKYTYLPDEKNIFKINFFYSKDKIELQEVVEPNWGNMLGGIGWLHSFSSTSDIEFNIYFSRSYMISDKNTDLLNGNYFIMQNYIDDFTANTKMNMQLNSHSLTMGVEIKKQLFTYDWNIDPVGDIADYVNPPQEVFFDFAPDIYNDSKDTYLLNAYVMDKVKISTKLNLMFGLRESYITKVNNVYLSPTLNINYMFSDEVDVSLNYAKYFQHMFTFKERQTCNRFSPFSVYFLAENDSQVGKSSHYSLSLRIKELLSNTTLEISPYYKKRENLPSSYFEYPRYRFEKGSAFGVDLMLRKEIGEITGWVGYSLAYSIKDNGEYLYYSNSDRRHSIKFLINYQLSERWRLNAFWTFATGNPQTETIGRYLGGQDASNNSDGYIGEYYSGWNPIYGSKNNLRTYSDHRLDVGITGNFIWGKKRIKPYLQILNIYNNANYYFVGADFRAGDFEENKFRSSFIIPTIGVTIEL